MNEKTPWEIAYEEAKAIMKNVSVEKLYGDMEKIFPIENQSDVYGALCNHYRRRLKGEGLESLLSQMDSKGLRKITAAYLQVK